MEQILPKKRRESAQLNLLYKELAPAGKAVYLINSTLVQHFRLRLVPLMFTTSDLNSPIEINGRERWWRCAIKTSHHLAWGLVKALKLQREKLE